MLKGIRVERLTLGIFCYLSVTFLFIISIDHALVTCIVRQFDWY